MKSQRVARDGRLCWALWLGLAALAALYAPTGMAQEKPECASCHDLTKKLEASKHAALTCDTCHDQHTAYPHPKNAAKPECSSCHSDESKMFIMSVHGRERAKGNTGAPECASCHRPAHEVASATTEAFRKTVPETCGMCHSEIGEQFQKSEHGKALAAGLKEAPTCTDCHGEHAILEKSLKTSPVNKAQIRDTCARCHGDLRLAGRFGLPADRITSFDASFHGLAAKGGSQTVANCASCHGFHTVLKSSDPKSMTHSSNLAKTCGQCHPGAGDRFAVGTIHWLEGGKEPGGVRYVRLFYWGVIPLTLGLMFLHHAGDFIRKLIALRFRKGGATGRASEGIPGEVRMLPFERLQHAMLALSFIILGWTGFALKFPDTFWAQPLVIWESLWPVRGTVHRIAAVVFTACGLLHVASLIVNRQLRQHWMTLLPRSRDVSEAIAQMLYNLGLRKTKPLVSPHSYVEKAEYWAVVWGALVMGVSGALLWFNNWAMAQFPKSWLDIATAVHYYEAVLACAAIVIWHFYTVLFDPDVYPMDTAWLTGRTVRKRPPHKEHETSPSAGD